MIERILPSPSAQRRESGFYLLFTQLGEKGKILAKAAVNVKLG